MNDRFNRLFEESIRSYRDSPSFIDYRKGRLTYGDVGKKILLIHAVYKA